MKYRLKSTVAILLIIMFGIFLPSFLLSESANIFVKESGLGMRTEAKYTDNVEKKILHDNYMRLEGQKEVFSAQKFEQRKHIYRLSMGLFAFLMFSLGVCLKRVYLSYIQFYSFSFVRFLREYYILLEKDGKKRSLAFGIS